jgi:hypothetical protein
LQLDLQPQPKLHTHNPQHAPTDNMEVFEPAARAAKQGHFSSQKILPRGRQRNEQHNPLQRKAAK